jgi:phosphatidylinositol 4-phosphatase
MDLLQGHYTTSVSREMSVPGKSGLLETYAVGKIATSWRFSLHMGL